ncbi:MAG: kinase [Verrucomicrobia bacterium]|nr:kinase [Verrucomicrobiota bacterium]MBI3869069.1 kinase [Verrucomicrobiota bacterium]
MIITRTPFRISFFGGGTDYPAWYREHGGAVLATAIDKYCYLSCRHLPPFFEHRIRVVYSKIENCNSLDEIEHPSVRETLKHLDMQRGVEIHHDGDLPARSGMGSSSAFTVGLLHAMYALQGKMPSKHQLAMESIHLEQEVLHETVGSQDQVTAAYGGFNHISFHPSGEISVRPMILAPARQKDLRSHLMLFYTGIKRTAAKVAETYVPALQDRKRQLRILRDMVEEAVEILSGTDDIQAFGHLLHEGWQAKRAMSDQVSSEEIDDIYERARAAGALGGKITGAGGGGFLLLFAPPRHHTHIREKLDGLLHVPFNFDTGGTQVIFYDQEQDYAAVEEDTRLRKIIPFREWSGAPSAGRETVAATRAEKIDY